MFCLHVSLLVAKGYQQTRKLFRKSDLFGPLPKSSQSSYVYWKYVVISLKGDLTVMRVSAHNTLEPGLGCIGLISKK